VRNDVTQVAAKVNDSEISVHQINIVLSKIPGVDAAGAKKLHKEVLDKLIDQQLVYDKATEQNLDRNPEVMLLIDAAKREIVAHAYMEKVLSKQSKVSEQDIHQYFLSNPNLFANRKIYSLQEVITEAKPALLDTLKQMASSGKGIDEFAKFLKDKGVKFTQAEELRPAEQVPLDLLPKMAETGDGHVEIFERENNYFVLRVHSSQLAPLSESAARPQIAAFLMNQRAQQATKEEIERLKRNAKIEYLGEFAKTSELNIEKALSIGMVDKSVAGLR
jgi:EpsD family peptidyl-prolyl cis-trans isomerase